MSLEAAACLRDLAEEVLGFRPHGAFSFQVAAAVAAVDPRREQIVFELSAQCGPHVPRVREEARRLRNRAHRNGDPIRQVAANFLKAAAAYNEDDE